MSRLGQNDMPAFTGRSSTQESHPNSKKPYKVVLESVTQEKKKLRSVVSYDVQAPSGYTFVPVGVRDLTEFCKETSRQQGLNVYVVSAALKNKAFQNPESLSHHVHRLGHHFRNDVVEKGCDWKGYRSHGHNYTRGNADGHLRTGAIAQSLETHGRRMGISGYGASTQQRNDLVCETIKELFPRIPNHDLNAIVSRAFEEGTGRVGDATHVPLARRVQLAVVAHIRHVYTEYDQLLRTAGWSEARRMVEQPCLDQIVKWRGEDNDGMVELEDIFQEVIILDDDDEDDSDSRNETTSENHTQVQENDRKSSLEIIASRMLATDLHDEESTPNKVYRPSHQGPADRVTVKPQPKDFEILPLQPRRSKRLATASGQEEIRRRWNDAQARARPTRTSPYPMRTITVPRAEPPLFHEQPSNFRESKIETARVPTASDSYALPRRRDMYVEESNQPLIIQQSKSWIPPTSNELSQHSQIYERVGGPFHLKDDAQPIRLYELREDRSQSRTRRAHVLERASFEQDRYVYEARYLPQPRGHDLRSVEPIYPSVEHRDFSIGSRTMTEGAQGVKRKSLPDLTLLRGGEEKNRLGNNTLKRLRVESGVDAKGSTSMREIIDLTRSPTRATIRENRSFASEPRSRRLYISDATTLNGCYERSTMPTFDTDHQLAPTLTQHFDRTNHSGFRAGEVIDRVTRLNSTSTISEGPRYLSNGKERLYAKEPYPYYETNASRVRCIRQDQLEPLQPPSTIPLRYTGRSDSPDFSSEQRSRVTRYRGIFEGVRQP